VACWAAISRGESRSTLIGNVVRQWEALNGFLWRDCVDSSGSDSNVAAGDDARDGRTCQVVQVSSATSTSGAQHDTPAKDRSGVGWSSLLWVASCWRQAS
jgi:hypothetical protein